MVFQIQNQSEDFSCIRVGLLLFLVLGLMVGCSSRHQTKVNSEQFSGKTKIVELEETPIEDTLIKPISSLENEKIELPPKPSLPVQPVSVEEPELESSEVPSSEPNGDLYASSGEGSTEVAIPQSTSISELAKPSDLENLPYTLSDIFFDYDQYVLQTNDLSALETNAKVLLGRYPKKKILIQGHCDERGTEEYNMALGVRRAQTVKDYLADLGVPPENMQVLSYGKEKPFCTQHSWNCWKHNRRSHFVFQ